MDTVYEYVLHIVIIVQSAPNHYSVVIWLTGSMNDRAFLKYYCAEVQGFWIFEFENYERTNKS